MSRNGGRAVPLPVLISGGLGAGFIAVTLAAIAWRAPWADLPLLLASPDALDAIVLSLIVSISATAACVIVGLPLAWTLARAGIRGESFVRAVVTLPMVLPPVVGGTGLLLAFGRNGILGAPLERLTGIRLPFTVPGAILAATFVALPFFVIAAESGLRSVDSRLEDAAATLGASRTRIFGRVTLPLSRNAVIGAAALAWARAFGEFGATITFAGNVAGATRTLPLRIFLALESQPETAFALSVVMLAVSLAVLGAMRGRLARVP